MAFNPLIFALGTVQAKQAGVTDSAARTRIALLGGLIGNPVTGLVITSVLAQREAKTETATQVVSLPPSTVQVQIPDVINQKFEDARKLLESPPLSLKVQRQNWVNIDKEVEIVLDQSPKAQATVAPGSVVTLSVNYQAVPVSKGLPEVIGLMVDQARKTLEPLGVKLATVDVPSSVTKGTVIMQNPDPETAVAAGDVITLLVSTGVSSGTSPTNPAGTGGGKPGGDGSPTGGSPSDTNPKVTSGTMPSG